MQASKPKKQPTKEVDRQENKSRAKAQDDASTKKSKFTPTKPAAQVVVKPPVWGGGRSFADVLAL